MKARWRAGFSLIELMIVVAVLSVLVSVAVIKYGNLLRRANEGALLGDLGAIRSALKVYYSSTEEYYPSDPSALSGKFISQLPAAQVPNYHPASAAVTYGAVADDSGGWLYNNTAGNAFGSVLVNCTHTDSRGSAWTSY